MSPDELRRLVRGLRPLAVRQYAEDRDWLRIEGSRRRIWLLRHRVDQLRQLQIPMDSDDPGFADAMLDVLHRLAEVEKRSTPVVLADLQWPDADVLRVRVASRDAEAGQLSLGADVMLREGARRALLASACSVLNPVAHHPRLSRTEADAMLAACRAGQTELASYVVKIICPLHAVNESLDPARPMPFTRRVTSHLMRVTSELVTSIEQSSVDTYIESQAGRPELSSNLCEALVRMQPDTGQLAISTTWAADPRVRPPVDVPSRVVIRAEYFSEIGRAAQLLRPALQGAREEWLVATVETLDGTVGPDGRRSGEVYFSLLSSEGESMRARASLDADMYEVAVHAHERGNAYVRIFGVLHRGARISRIEPLRRLEPWDDFGAPYNAT